MLITESKYRKIAGPPLKEIKFNVMKISINRTDNVITKIIRTLIRTNKKKGELMALLKNPRLLSIYHIDYLSPMTVTHIAYQYILIVIDCFSKFTWLYPTKTVTAKKVINS